MLGLSPPSDASAFEIEYDHVIKSDREVFKEATVNFLRTGENLEVLQWGQMENKVIDLPSWVPDLSVDTYPRNPLDDTYATDGGSDTWVRLTDTKPSKKSPKPCRPEPSFSEDSEVLILQGLIVDSVHISDRTPDHGFFLRSDATYMERKFKKLDPLIDTAKKWERILTRYKPDPYTASPGRRHEALWRTLIADRIRHGDQVVAAPSYLGRSFDPWMGRNGPSWKEMKSRRTMSTFTYQAQEYLGAMGRWMTSRAFLITDRGLVGLGPASMRKGDVVCVLRGGEVPFILRPLEGEYYEFVGECYVHG